MRSSPDYPLLLEQSWVEIAKQVTGTADSRAAMTRLESAAGSLSDAFTTGRDPSFNGYGSNRKALAAYGLFFFPRAYVRTLLVLRECGTDFRPTRITDLGAGTGAAGLACLHFFSDAKPMHLHLVDRAKEGLDLAQTIFSESRSLWPNASLRTTTADARDYQHEDEVDLIISSFAVNEWMENEPAEDKLFEWVKKQLKSLRPGGRLILLEPALHATVERMERLRDRIAEHHVARILAPCPHHAPCPMLAQKRGWCHEVREWKVPESLRWINRQLLRDVHLLKFSMLVLEKGPPKTADTPWMRLVSPVKKENGKYVVHGCGHDGHLHTCEWLTKRLSAGQKAASEELERGDRVKWSKTAVLGDGKTERGDGPPGKTNVT